MQRSGGRTGDGGGGSQELVFEGVQLQLQEAKHGGMTEVPLLHHHCTIAAPSLHHHCTIAAPSLHHQRTITAPSVAGEHAAAQAKAAQAAGEPPIAHEGQSIIHQQTRVM